MSCYRTWETAAGKTMPMHEMSVRHIENALRIVREIADTDVPYPALRSDDAQYHAEQQWEHEQNRQDEAREWVDAFEKELVRRGPDTSRAPLTPIKVGRRS